MKSLTIVPKLSLTCLSEVFKEKQTKNPMLFTASGTIAPLSTYESLIFSEGPVYKYNPSNMCAMWCKTLIYEVNYTRVDTKQIISSSRPCAG